jgi:hypothetical protein
MTISSSYRHILIFFNLVIDHTHTLSCILISQKSRGFGWWTVNGNKYIKIFYADLGSIKEDRAEKTSG